MTQDSSAEGPVGTHVSRHQAGETGRVQRSLAVVDSCCRPEVLTMMLPVTAWRIVPRTPSALLDTSPHSPQPLPPRAASPASAR